MKKKKKKKKTELKGVINFLQLTLILLILMIF